MRDSGTSNSAAAIFDGRQVRIVQLEASNLVMPSACYIDTGFSVETGEQAIRTYIEENRGRWVEFVYALKRNSERSLRE